MESNNKHLPYFISGGLLLSFLFDITGSFFPSESLAQTILFKIDTLLAITAFACLGSKAASEKYDIASAGFGILAIAQGLFLAKIDQALHWNYDTADTAILFLLPALVLISYYKPFPKWLRYGGILLIIPFLMILIIHLISSTTDLSFYVNIIFLLYHSVTLCWAWQIWNKRNN